MERGALIGPVIIAIGLVIAAIAFAVVTVLLDTADGGADLRLSRLEAGLARKEAAAEERDARLDGLAADLARLRDETSLIANRAATFGPAPAALPPDADFETPPDHGIGPSPSPDLGPGPGGAPTEALTEQMRLARSRFNRGVTQPRNAVMMELLGPPRDSYSTDCQPVTNPALKARIATRDMGPFRVTMLGPALDSLARVLERLKASDPDIHAKLGTAGALCARLIRGSASAVSNHSWGTAIDLTLEGRLDGFADGGTQFGLLILAEYFNDEGWFWGAAYDREDSMHFEVGEETLRAWKAAGKI